MATIYLFSNLVPTSITACRRRSWLARALSSLALIAAASGSLSAQYATITVDSSSPYVSRPVYEAIRQIQKLSSIPINYEDLQYDFTDDLTDTANSVLTAAQRTENPNTKVIVPKGGSFSANVPVDPSTGKLSDALSVGNALNIVISDAQAAGVIPGSFRVDFHSGVFFVEPGSKHSSTGLTVLAQPVFDTPVTVSFQQTLAIQVLDAILQQVSQNTGARFVHGMGTLALSIPWAKVNITASNEPAKYVLARLLAAVYATPGGAPPAVAYHALIDPMSHTYAFNILNRLVLQPPPPAVPYSPPPLVPGPNNRLGAVKTK